MKVLFVFNHPAPYKVNFFNELAKYCDLTVIFERKGNKDRNKNFYNATCNFKTIFTKGINFGNENNFSFNIKKHLKRNHYDLIVMNGYHTVSEMIAIKYLKKNRMPYIFYINGGITKQKESKIKEAIKRKYISGAISYFSPDKRSNDYLIHYGADENKIINYPYSTIYKSDIVKGEINKIELRTKLNLPLDKKIVISCGQFIKRKNYSTLLKQWKYIDEYQLVLIGGGKQKQEFINYVKKENMNNVLILDFLKKEQLFEYFRASDVFIFPSKEDIYGHVINEAMSQGLPCLSSGNVNSTLNLIKNGETGFIYKVDDLVDMKEKLDSIIMDQKFFSKNAIDMSKKYTIETMGKFHIKQLEEIHHKPRLIYLTNAMDEYSYKDLIEQCNKFPNPSNQNFHNRMIDSLKTQFDIDVLSLRPLFKGMLLNTKELKREEKEIKNTKFIYPLIKTSKTDRAFKLDKRLNKELNKLLINNKEIIIVDTLNLHLLKLAIKYQKKFNVKVIGIVTDNPRNLTNVKSSYAEKVIKLSSRLDGYICLTKELNDLFNIHHMPNTIIEGIIDEYNEHTKVQQTPYIFFGGALYERYGIMDLVKAFIDGEFFDYDLVIAGHGELDQKITDISKIKRNIKFKGVISKQEMLAYEQQAIACVNPRRKDPALENESIPSKVIEYISSKSQVISVENKKLHDIFNDNIIWCNSEDLTSKIRYAIKNQNKEETKIKIDNAYNIANKNYSFKSVGKKIDQFLECFWSSSSIK